MTAAHEDEPFGGEFRGRRVFVTGHTGFKGSWLCSWLLRLGAEVSGYALEPNTAPSLFDDLGLAGSVDHVIGDVRDLDALKGALLRARPEVVFHMAAQPLVRRSYAEPVYTYATNVLGTVNLLEAVRSFAGTRAVVNVTTDKVYEDRETGRAYAEDAVLGGRDPYSSSKACSELVTAAYRSSFFADAGAALVASARAGNVIGGGDWADDRILPDCARALAADRSIEVRNPESVRPWQHVLEPLSGYLWLASRLWHGETQAAAWNFGPAGDEALTVRDVVNLSITEWGSGSWRRSDLESQPHEAKMLQLDVTRAREHLQWTPQWDARRAVRTTVAWYRGYNDDPGGAARLVGRDIAAYEAGASASGAAWRA